MASKQFAEVNGARVDVTGMATFWEIECDHCGQYAALNTIPRIQITVHTQTGDTPEVVMDLHESCIVTGAVKIATRISAAVTECPPF